MNIAWLAGLIILAVLVILLLAGAPIAVALAVSSICAILPVLELEPAVLTGAQRIFSGISVFNLIAIPFFILAGNIMNKGGIAIRLINFAKILTGQIPGALAAVRTWPQFRHIQPVAASDTNSFPCSIQSASISNLSPCIFSTAAI